MEGRRSCHVAPQPNVSAREFTRRERRSRQLTLREACKAALRRIIDMINLFFLRGTAVHWQSLPGTTLNTSSSFSGAVIFQEHHRKQLKFTRRPRRRSSRFLPGKSRPVFSDGDDYVQEVQFFWHHGVRLSNTRRFDFATSCRSRRTKRAAAISYLQYKLSTNSEDHEEDTQRRRHRFCHSRHERCFLRVRPDRMAGRSLCNEGHCRMRRLGGRCRRRGPGDVRTPGSNTATVRPKINSSPTSGNSTPSNRARVRRYATRITESEYSFPIGPQGGWGQKHQRHRPPDHGFALPRHGRRSGDHHSLWSLIATRLASLSFSGVLTPQPGNFAQDILSFFPRCSPLRACGTSYRRREGHR